MKRIESFICLVICLLFVYCNGAQIKSNVGGRHSSFDTEKQSWSNPYITDGLVAMWDGEWNAGGGISDDELRCMEITGNNGDVTFLGDVERTKNGFYLNKKRLSSGFGYGLSTLLRKEDVENTSTVQICVEIPNKYNHWEGIFRYNVADIGVNAVLNWYYHKNGGARSACNQGFSFSVGQKVVNTVIFTVGQDRPRCFINDYESGSVDVNGPYHTNTYNEVLVGVGYDSDVSKWKPCCMVMYSIRVYNRALSEEEISYNCNVDKVRFGL